MAAAIRRGDHGRVPGAVGHRDEGGAGAGRRARGRRGEAALREADAEPRRLRRLLEGRGICGSCIDPPSLRKALVFYEQAVALDPDFAQAWARVASAKSLLYANAVPTPALAERARQAAEKAVALAPNRPEGYLALGQYHRLVARTSTALEQYQKGLRLAPGDASLSPWQEPSGPRALGCGRGAPPAGGAPRSTVAERSEASGRSAASVAALSRGSRTLDRGLALAPCNLNLVENKAMTYLGEGTWPVPGPCSGPPQGGRAHALVAFLANYWDLVWVLDGAARASPAADAERVRRRRGRPGPLPRSGLCPQGRSAQARPYAEEAKKAFEEQLRSARGPHPPRLPRPRARVSRPEGGSDPDSPSRRRVSPVDKDAYGPYFQHQLARIYILVGEPEKALDQLEPLLKIPYYLSPGWLKIDPNFDPLREQPPVPEARRGQVGAPRAGPRQFAGRVPDGPCE